MANSAARSSAGGRQDINTNDHQDDASDITPTGGVTIRRNEQSKYEMTLKFRFAPAKAHLSQEMISPIRIHLQWVQIIQDVFKTAIHIIGNNGKNLQKIDPLRWNEKQHEEFFKLQRQYKDLQSESRNGSSNARGFNSKVTQQSSFIIHRIKSEVPLHEIKNVSRIFDLLRENECFLTEHRWSEDVWDTTQLGFILGINPQFYNVDTAYEKVQHKLKTTLPSRIKIPKFQIAFTTPKINANQTQIRTKAFAIETEKSQSKEMLKLLKMAYTETNEFIPFQMRTKHPEAYTRVLLQQSKIIMNQHVVVLQNISTDSMYYLIDHIRATVGVKDVKATITVANDGKHKVLVDKSAFHKVRNELMNNLLNWYDTVPPDAKRLDERYISTPEVAPISLDGLSSGEGTYMSSSVNTAMSYETTLSDLQQLNNNNEAIILNSTIPIPGLAVPTPPNWAQRVRGNPSSTSTSQTTQGSVPASEDFMSDLVSSKAEVEELKTKLQTIEESKAAQQREMELKVEQQRLEMELQLAQQRLELERQADKQKQEIEERATLQRHELEKKVEAQRHEFQMQLMNQRKDFEQQTRDNQREMQEHMDLKIKQAMQHQQTPREDAQMSTYLANQQQQMQMITTMFVQVMQQTKPRETLEVKISSTGKRSTIDLTDDTPQTTQEDELMVLSNGMDDEHVSEVKRQDTKQTPVKADRPDAQLRERSPQHLPGFLRRTENPPIDTYHGHSPASYYPGYYEELGEDPSYDSLINDDKESDSPLEPMSTSFENGLSQQHLQDILLQHEVDITHISQTLLIPDSPINPNINTELHSLNSSPPLERVPKNDIDEDPRPRQHLANNEVRTHDEMENPTGSSIEENDSTQSKRSSQDKVKMNQNHHVDV